MLLGWCVGVGVCVVDVGRQVEQLETAEEKQAKEREEQAKRKQVGGSQFNKKQGRPATDPEAEQSMVRGLAG